jgi:hypothetical protein
MFRELMNFAYRRSALQALGWYCRFACVVSSRSSGRIDPLGRADDATVAKSQKEIGQVFE